MMTSIQKAAKLRVHWRLSPKAYDATACGLVAHNVKCASVIKETTCRTCKYWLRSKGKL